MVKGIIWERGLVSGGLSGVCCGVVVFVVCGVAMVFSLEIINFTVFPNLLGLGTQLRIKFSSSDDEP